MTLFQLGGVGSLKNPKYHNVCNKGRGLRSAIVNIADGGVLWSQVFTWKQAATRLSENWKKAVATMSSSYGRAAAKLTGGFHIVVKLWPSSLQKITKTSSSCSKLLANRFNLSAHTTTALSNTINTAAWFTSSKWVSKLEAINTAHTLIVPVACHFGHFVLCIFLAILVIVHN